MKDSIYLYINLFLTVKMEILIIYVIISEILTYISISYEYLKID